MTKEVAVILIGIGNCGLSAAVFLSQNNEEIDLIMTNSKLEDIHDSISPKDFSPMIISRDIVNIDDEIMITEKEKTLFSPTNSRVAELVSSPQKPRLISNSGFV